MIKHNKVRTTKSRKQIETSKSIYNNTFKTSLIVLTSLVMFMSLLIIGFVLVKGVFGANQVINEGEGSWLFGNKYDGAVYFAAGFMLVNTIWTTTLSIFIAVPISVITAIFITRVAPNSMRTIFFVTLSILAAIPSVIYGAFGNKVIDTMVNTIFNADLGSVLSIVITLSFMIMPTITLITATTINSVDKKLESSSLALGATKNQTSFYITIRAALPGIVTATILGVGRALGEATAVSMISVDPYTGPSFGIFGQIRLLTATMLKGYNEMDAHSIQQASMFAMGMILIISVLIVFLSMRLFQVQSNPEVKAKKASKKIRAIRTLEQEVEELGLENVSISKQKKYNKLSLQHDFNELVDEYYNKQYKMGEVINKTTIKTNYEKQKAKKSKGLGILTWAIASIGVIFLVSIIGFLLIYGLPGLSWEYISSSGSVPVSDATGGELPGLQTTIFGTMTTIIISLLLIVPLGLGAGIYFSTFANKNKWYNKFLLMAIDILTGIPSLIFGLVGFSVFLPFASFIGFTPLAGAIILTLIVLPTVVQTTQQAINSVPQQTIRGSLALGSTKTTASLRISLPQALPQILSGIVLAIGRMIGESAAIVMVFGTVARESAGEWLSYGGTTLATEMYRLTLLEEIPWHQVTAIGLVILSLILMLSLLSNFISGHDYLSAGLVFVSLLVLLLGIFVANTIGLVIFILGILLLFFTIGFKIYRGRN